MNNAIAAMDVKEGDRFRLGDKWLVADLVVSCTARATTLIFYRDRASLIFDGVLEFDTADRKVDNIPVMRIIP